MKDSKMLIKAQRTLNTLSRKAKKNSPELLVATGVAGLIVSGVIACRQTLKAKEVIDKYKEDTDAVIEYAESDEGKEDGYDIQTAETAVKQLKVKTALKLVGLYAPPVLMAGTSAAAILYGHNVLNKRYAVLTTAYKALEGSFKEYRDRVVERFGSDVDKELLYNIKKEKIEKEVEDENGKKKKVKEEGYVINGETISSPYAKFFDESSREWVKNPELNLLKLRSVQERFDNFLKTRGHVFLNEIYDALDIPRTAIGAVCGWIYDPSDPDTDDHIDFNIYNVHDPANRRFVNGLEPVILLDFNCQGNIVDKI